MRTLTERLSQGNWASTVFKDQAKNNILFYDFVYLEFKHDPDVECNPAGYLARPLHAYAHPSTRLTRQFVSWTTISA